MMNREELISIRNRAEISIFEGMNPCWARAYENLADAADKIDAMMARNSIEVKQERSLDKKSKEAFNNLITEMKQYIEKYKSYATDKWTDKEVIKFVWEILTDAIIQIQKSCKDLDGEQKKKLAIEFVEWCYFDKACLNNPRILSSMPNFVENFIEKYVIDNVVPDAIEKIIAIFKKFGINGFSGQKDFLIQIPNKSIQLFEEV